MIKTHRRALNQAELTVLEMMIDEVGLHSFMEGLASIAAEKSEHIQANYADGITAKAWQKTADYLTKIADSEHMKIF